VGNARRHLPGAPDQNLCLTYPCKKQIHVYHDLSLPLDDYTPEKTESIVIIL